MSPDYTIKTLKQDLTRSISQAHNNIDNVDFYFTPELPLNAETLSEIFSDKSLFPGPDYTLKVLFGLKSMHAFRHIRPRPSMEMLAELSELRSKECVAKEAKEKEMRENERANKGAKTDLLVRPAQDENPTTIADILLKFTALSSRLSAVEAELGVVKEEWNTVNDRLDVVEAELSVVKKENKALGVNVSKLTKDNWLTLRALVDGKRKLIVN